MTERYNKPVHKPSPKVAFSTENVLFPSKESHLQECFFSTLIHGNRIFRFHSQFISGSLLCP